MFPAKEKKNINSKLFFCVVIFHKSILKSRQIKQVNKQMSSENRLIQ